MRIQSIFSFRIRNRYRFYYVTAFMLTVQMFSFHSEAAIQATKRVALMIGANNGGPGRVRLQYAGSDALQFSHALEELGGLEIKDRTILRDPDSLQVANALTELSQRAKLARSTYQRVEAVVYYSGHADEEGLLIKGKCFSFRDFRKAVDDVPAAVRIAVVDACASGSLTRLKGGTALPAFLADQSSHSEGYAILTSSSANEAAQESDRIGASFFSHYLNAGLRGAADNSQDGRVTLHEAYQYAYNETLARTEGTEAGPQHPSYDMRISGSGEVVMTDISKAESSLEFLENSFGRYFIRDSEGRLVAEIQKPKGKPLVIGLQSGKYSIRWQGSGGRSGSQSEKLSERSIVLEKGKSLQLDDSHWKKIEGEVATLRGDTKTEFENPWPSGDTGWQFSGLMNRTQEPWVGNQLSLLYNESKDDMVGTQVAFGINDANGRLKGAQIGGLNLAESELQGFQASYFLNMSKGPLHGFQGSSMFNFALDDVHGGQAAVFVNIINGSVHGGQGAGFFNVIKGDLRGGQGAAFFNVLHGDLVGGQGAGFFNITTGNTKGGLGAGFFNITADSVTGGLGAGFFNYTAGNIKGGEGAGFFNVIQGNLDGGMGAGFFNATTGNVKGAQVAGFTNLSLGNLKGFQGSAFLNIADTVRGNQFGIINIARSYQQGAPLGLFNFVGDGVWQAELLRDESEYVHLNLLTGTPLVFSRLGVGFRPSPFATNPGFNEQKAMSIDYGFGLHFNAKPVFYETELSGSDLFALESHRSEKNGKKEWYEPEELYRARVTVGYPIFSVLSLVGGFGYTLMINSDRKSDPLSGNNWLQQSESDALLQHWPSFHLGIRLGKPWPSKKS